MTTAAAAARADAARSRSRRAAREIEVAPDGTFARGAASGSAGAADRSLLLEGGAALHAAAWDEGLVDFVRLYVTPHVLGAGGVPLLRGPRVFVGGAASSGGSSRSDPMC